MDTSDLTIRVLLVLAVICILLLGVSIWLLVKTVKDRKNREK